MTNLQGLVDTKVAISNDVSLRPATWGGEEVSSIDILRWRKKGYFPSIIADRVPGQVDLFPIPSSETSTNPLIK